MRLTLFQRHMLESAVNRIEKLLPEMDSSDFDFVYKFFTKLETAMRAEFQERDRKDREAQAAFSKTEAKEG